MMCKRSEMDATKEVEKDGDQKLGGSRETLA